ncbi:MAG: NADP-dependent isocitrate dehydrogenase, partial [Thiothrix sp.]|nr:NADP-dependent isocitrate dehydrogenase [Thiothrix sp.]
DYLTDLFPIMEVGTSAKMLSVVPLMQGGGLYETGAGGTAPVLVKQLLEENHLSWDSLGEFLALTVSFEQVARQFGNNKAKVLSETLDRAIGDVLLNDKSPKPRTGELDTRGNHFYLALYWAQELARQSEEPEMAAHFSKLADILSENEEKILAELNSVQGQSVDIGGYFFADSDKTKAVMRPSATFTDAIMAARMPGFTAAELDG